MLVILIEIAEKHYALEISHIVEIVPLVKINTLSHLPKFLAGVINYRGNIIPVVDLSYLITGNYSKYLLSTRIIILENDKENALFGVLAEKVTETLTIKEEAYKLTNIQRLDAPFLDNILINKDNIIQIINFRQLLPQNFIDELAEYNE